MPQAMTRLTTKSLKRIEHKISRKSALSQAADEISKKSKAVVDSRVSWFRKIKEGIK